MNGRAVCDSHHINEDVLYATYHAAVEAMIEDAGVLLEVIQTETEVEMQPRNKAEMDEVEQQIIELQERVLDLHKQKRAMKISDAYYNAQVNDYSQQLGALESRKQALQTADARYATVRMWLADFRQHMQKGDATDDRDGSIMKTLVEAIIVWDDRIEVRFKCGCSKTRATVTVALLMTRLKNRTTGSRKNICASPAALRQHFYGNSIAQRCGDFKLRRPRPRSPP